MKKKIAILGSTGSIGKQALQVIQEQQDKFELEILVANTKDKDLIDQALIFNPNTVVIADKSKYQQVNESLSPQGIKVYAGPEAVMQLFETDSIDIVINAIVGYAGLQYTIQAIKGGKDVALANKESLVIAGALIKELSKKYQTNIYPVDSEHSAIFQCMAGEELRTVEKIYLTASGGPFLNTCITKFNNISPEAALKHPNWNMGSKITIDSATLMNKGLEVIEAKWLFGLQPSQIEVIIHPQSIIHSMVLFKDGSIKAQMGLPDMRIPIQYALSYPDRHANQFQRFDFTDYPQLTFEKPDYQKFPNLRLAYEAMKKDGNMPCILNAANEITVKGFLNQQISFADIPIINEKTMGKASYISSPGYEDFIESDKQAREIAMQLVDGSFFS
jgi:1-deoxy-D-xylulose-5-phosphate reductoisomerase